MAANIFYKLGDLWSSFSSKAQERAFFTNRIQFMGKREAVYLDTNTPYNLFNQIPEINQVINKKSDMLSNGVFKLYKRDTEEEVEDKELMALLNKPNFLQPQNKWIKMYQNQLDVYGNQFIYANKPTVLSKYPKALTHISPHYMTVKLTGKLFDQVDIEGVVKEYEYKDEGGGKRKFEPKEIIWSRHDDLDNPLAGVSPLKSLRFPLTNTKLAYDYLNVISGEKGAIGVLSGSSKDGFGALPMSDEDKKALEQQYLDDYGVSDGQRRVKIASSPVTWTPMTYPTRDLLLLEQIDANKLTLCDHFGLNINIFSSKNQTYENVKNALIQSYNDAVMPAADALCQVLTEYLQIPDTTELRLDFSHVSILQKDELTDANILTTQLNSVKEAVNAGILTPQQAVEIYRNSFGLEF